MGWLGVTGAHLQYGWTYTDAVNLPSSICHHLQNKLRANASKATAEADDANLFPQELPHRSVKDNQKDAEGENKAGI